MWIHPAKIALGEKKMHIQTSNIKHPAVVTSGQ
jgi:hypothetical protein